MTDTITTFIHVIHNGINSKRKISLFILGRQRMLNISMTDTIRTFSNTTHIGQDVKLEILSIMLRRQRTQS